MRLVDRYRFRPPTPDDVDAIAEVLIADDLDRTGASVLGADFVREVWSRPGFELVTDAWVVIDEGGTVVAYGQVREEEPAVIGSWGVVHPAHRGRGLGGVLFERIEARASERLGGDPSGRFQHAISAGDIAAERLLGARGLRPHRYFWHMQIDLEAPIDPGPAPIGIRIASVDPYADLATVHAVLDEAFDWGDRPEPFERWAERETASPGYDPALWLLAWDGRRPVGALTAGSGDDGGWVDWLAVVASHRGRGIGEALLRRSFASFVGRGTRRVLVAVDAGNPTGATALYERVGMRVVNRWDLWQRAGH